MYSVNSDRSFNLFFGKFEKDYSCHPKIILKELCCSKRQKRIGIIPSELVEAVTYQQHVKENPFFL